MARGIQNYPNIKAPDSDYPNGRIKDNPGNNTGTPVKELTYGDIHQFFAKLMRVAGITPNGLPDNEYNGLQYFLALRIAVMPYLYYSATIFQSSTSNPTATEMPGNTLTGGIVWTRTIAGTYVGTKAGAFASGNVLFLISGSVTGFIKGIVNDANTVVVNTKSIAGAAADGILDNVSLEIRVY